LDKGGTQEVENITFRTLSGAQIVPVLDGGGIFAGVYDDVMVPSNPMGWFHSSRGLRRPAICDDHMVRPITIVIAPNNHLHCSRVRLAEHHFYLASIASHLPAKSTLSALQKKAKSFNVNL